MGGVAHLAHGLQHAQAVGDGVARGGGHAPDRRTARAACGTPVSARLKVIVAIPVVSSLYKLMMISI